MKKIFVDTNFIIDLLSRPEFSGQASQILATGRESGFKFYICFLSLANYAYIDRKQNREKIYENLRMLGKVFEVWPNDKYDIAKAIDLNPKDFEDALQYSAALKAGCDCIITRNQKDFEFSQIPVLSPMEFLQSL